MSCSGGVAAPPPWVCFFGTYAAGYTVTRLLRDACHAAGVGVVECHRPLWEKTQRKDARYFGAWSVLRLSGHYLREIRALARARRQLGQVPLYLVGFNGQLDCVILRGLLWRSRAPIVFAPLVTLTETLVDDRRVFAPRSFKACLVRRLDRLSLRAATRIVIDTDAHRQYLIEQFGIPAHRVVVWYLGADTSVFRAAPQPLREGPLRVVFYGSFLPLHGSRTVLDAATLLGDDRRVEFVMLGDGPQRDACMRAAHDVGGGHVQFRDWVSYEQLGDLVAAADICLGIFGTTSKAAMVIPNKVYQAAAVGRPVITADTPAVREVFAHGENAWLCPAGDAAALADAIRRLCDDQDLRVGLGRRAAALMAKRFAPAAQAARMAAILAEATHAR